MELDEITFMDLLIKLYINYTSSWNHQILLILVMWFNPRNIKPNSDSSTTNNNIIKVDNTIVFSSRYIVFLCESNFHPSYTKTQSVIWYHLKVLWYLYFLSLKWNAILFIINQRYDYTHINYISYPKKKNKPHICKSINK